MKKYLIFVLLGTLLVLFIRILTNYKNNVSFFDDVLSMISLFVLIFWIIICPVLYWMISKKEKSHS